MLLRVSINLRCTQVTELSETTRGSGGFGSTGVEQSTLKVSAVENGVKKLKANPEPVRSATGIAWYKNTSTHSRQQRGQNTAKCVVVAPGGWTVFF